MELLSIFTIQNNIVILYLQMQSCLGEVHGLKIEMENLSRQISSI